MRYRFQFQISTPIFSTGIIDILLPTNFIPQNNCQNYYTNPLPASGDDIICTKNAGTNTWELTGLGSTITAGSTYTIEGWVRTPSSATTSPTFTITAYNDGPARQLRTFTATASGPDV